MNVTTSIWSSFISQVFLFSFAAAFGGIVLFIGLWKEWKAHKDGLDKTDWHSNIGDFRKSKRKAKCGQIWVMGGVGIEVALAIAVSIHGVCKQFKTDKAIEANDPRSQPISDMSATVVLLVMGRDFNDMTNWDSRRVARLTLWKNEKTQMTLDALDAESFTRNNLMILVGNPNASNSREYGIRFRSLNFIAFSDSEPPVKSIDDAQIARLEINFLPRGEKIAGGGIDLVVNNVRKQFRIFPQSDTNFPDGMPGVPYIVIATNISESKPE